MVVAWLALLLATPSAAAAEPWWRQVAFAGHDVFAVRASGSTIAVDVADIGQQQSTDGGRTWTRILERHGLLVPSGSPWRVGRDGAVGQLDGNGMFHRDPASPQLAEPPVVGAHPGLLAAPAALPGVVVAVDKNNVVWRRAADGTWARALLLLPQGIAAGPPHITALVAFDTAPLTPSVYLATDGYSVLASRDGGDDWFRDDLGLPSSVDALYADPTTQSLYAGTSDGLWVHHLRATPTPPAYADAQLRWRWLGIALVTLAGSAVAIGALLRSPLS